MRIGMTIGLIAAILLALAPAETLNAQNAELVGQWDGFGGNYGDVWAEGDYAYLAHFGHGGVSIVDISDPTNPTGFNYDLPSPNQNASGQDVKTWNGMMFVALEGDTNGSVHIVDIRDPMQPVEVVNVVISGMTRIHNLFLADGFLYIVDSSTPRVAIIDVRDLDPDNPPQNPIRNVMWMLENVGSVFVHDITVAGGRLYACGWDSGLFIYDVTNIANQTPVFLGQTPDGGNNTHAVWPTDDGNFVMTGEERADGPIKVYRITDNGGSLTLERTDELVIPGDSTHNQVIVGNRAFISWYSHGLQVFDINPSTGQLEFVAAFDTTSAWGVYPFLGEETVLVSDIRDGLIIVNVTPTTPATLTDVNIVTGVVLGGGLPELGASDDSYFQTRSGFGVTLSELHKMEVQVSASTAVQGPQSLEISIEARISEPAGTAQVSLLNHSTGGFDVIGSYAIGAADFTKIFPDIDATDLVNAQGEIELRARHIVFVPFLAFTFESWLDHVAIDVN